ncbi:MULTISPECIES: glycosyltransferase family A protein [unclassified Marinimicrobium]|jgi:glycosyltransferase involved in cell wall biosynthesis|uniref:glycosyltransferase family A protein n=3 Tax=Marinimicrobium TaxID=359337 RepID=UPI00257EE356|nr:MULTISPECIES: glycosyltransferase family A protein [unclassified Marinimicrobium]
MTDQISDISVAFCIFSFNRAQFLENCVDSIRKCAPYADILIFDDESTDPLTQSYLERIRETVTIVQPAIKGRIKHGGLYHNMQSALEATQHYSLVCFLQDDTQVIRPVALHELAQLHSILEENASVGFIHPCFIRGIDLNRNPVSDDPGPTQNTYLRRATQQSAGIHYSDLLVTSPQKLLKKQWRFLQSEPGNDRQAKALFGRMLYLYSPFAMWLPEVPAWRGKKKTLALKIAERKKQCGYYPFIIWSAEQADQFLRRSPKEIPVAESLLECTPITPRKPWTYNPLTGLRGLKLLNNLEVKLKRL